LEPEYKLQSLAEAALDKVVPLARREGFPEMGEELSLRQTRLIMNYLESRNLQHVWPTLYGHLSGVLGAPVGDRGLDRFGRILTDSDELEHLDRAFLRDETVDLLLDHFSDSDTGRSMLLVGAAGSGKTALVHEFVRRLVEESEPVTVLETNTSELMTGTRYLGEWETKLKEMTDAILAHPNPVIVYMKNPNDLIGAGAHSKSDESFADFFKPYLERRSIRMLAETTPEMLKGGLSRDPGFLRLFQQVRVETMSTDDTTTVLVNRLEYVKGRGGRSVQADRHTLEHITDLARSFYTRSEAPGRACDLMDAVIEHIGRERHKLLSPEVPLRIAIPDVPRALATTTGIDVTLLDDEVALDLDGWRQWFEDRLVAQDDAVAAAMNRISLVKAGLRNPDKPLATMFLVGPTGVGKTYFAKLVAERLFGDASRIVRFDLSEFQGRYAVDKLVGVPHERDRDGLLTEAIHQQPYCVLLFDEFEKADPEVYHLLLQVLDEGRLTDARGRTADFRQAFIVMTSNLGASRVGTSAMGFGKGEASLKAHIRSKMEEVFQPEFINRLDDIVVFSPLDEASIRRLVSLEVAKLASRRGFRRHQLRLVLSESAVDHLARRGFSARFGARELKRVLEKDLLAGLSKLLIRRQAPDRRSVVDVDVDEGGLTIRLHPEQPPASRDVVAPAPEDSRPVRRYKGRDVEPPGSS
jgi:ATP-dependent Clp protease ATP-binding subunit ClpC